MVVQCDSQAYSFSYTTLLQVVVVEHSAHGVDLPEDVASLEAIMSTQGLK